MADKFAEDEPPQLGIRKGLEHDKNEPYGRVRSLTRMLSFVLYFLSACTMFVSLSFRVLLH